MMPINPSNVEELRRYVTAKDNETRFTPSTLCLNISHSSLKQRWIEIRFDLEETVGKVKERLYRHGGTAPGYQRLQLLDPTGRLVCEMVNDRACLRDYNAKNNYEIRIIDQDPNSLARSGWLEDTSLVEKYVMPDEVYDAREGTVRKYKEHLRQNTPDPDGTEIDVNENLKPGQRCEVFPGGRRGAVRFVGSAEGLGEGCWVGVELDEPLGKNDGSVKGVRYFTCKPNYGVVVRADKVTPGDFPIRGLGDSSDDEM
jgi:tubulin-folding cofactor B